MKKQFTYMLIAALYICSAFQEKYNVDEKTFFHENCGSCHHTHREDSSMAPPLYKIRDYRSFEWIQKYIHNYAKLVAEGDTEATIVFMHYGQIAMPAFPSLSETDITKILDYVDSSGQGNAMYSHRKLTEQQKQAYIRKKREQDSVYHALENDPYYIDFVNQYNTDSIK